MTDFSGTREPLPTHISSWSFWAAEAEFVTGGATMASIGSTAWPAANMAIYVPLSLPWDYPVRRVWWGNGSALGNMAFGLYTINGGQIYASASTAQSGASAIQYVTPATDFILPAGRYYMALINDGTTNRVWGSTLTAIDGRMRGLLQQAVGSMTLPSSMTGAQYAQTAYPLCGISRTASGF